MSITGVTKLVNPPQLANEISRMFPAAFKSAAGPKSSVITKGRPSGTYIDVEDGTNFGSVNFGNSVGTGDLPWAMKFGFSVAGQINRLTLYTTQQGEKVVPTDPYTTWSQLRIYDGVKPLVSGIYRGLEDHAVNYTDEFDNTPIEASNLFVEMETYTDPVANWSTILYMMWVEIFKIPTVTWNAATGTITCPDINDSQLAQALSYHNAYFPPIIVDDSMIGSMAPEKLAAGILAAGKAIYAPRIIVPNEKDWRVELTDGTYVLRYWDGNETRLYIDDIGNIVIAGGFVGTTANLASGKFHVETDGSLGIGGKTFALSPFKVNADGSMQAMDHIKLVWPGDDRDSVTLSVLHTEPGMAAFGPDEGLSFRTADSKPWLKIGAFNDVGNIYITDQPYLTQQWPPILNDPVIPATDVRPASGSIIFGSSNVGGGGGVHLMEKDTFGVRYNLTDGAVLARLTSQFSVASFTAEQTILTVNLPAGWLGEDMYLEGQINGSIQSVAGTATFTFRWYLGTNVVDSYGMNPGTGTAGFHAHHTMAVRDAGSSGTVVGGTWARGGAATSAIVSSQPAAVAVDTTIINTLKLTVACTVSNAANKIVVDLGFFRIVTTGS